MDGSSGGPRNSGPGSSYGSGEVTRVDLGDDLLQERTRVLRVGDEPSLGSTKSAASPPVTPAPIKPETIDDSLETARILASEGFHEEAKKLLRRILISYPRNKLARKRLDEIHEQELQQIFGQNESRRSEILGRFRESRENADIPYFVDTESVIRALEQELDLGQETRGWGPSLIPSVQEDASALESVSGGIETSFAEAGGASSRDRIDVGIGFLEMGLHELATRQFRLAKGDPAYLLEATNLLATALIDGGRGFEAANELESIIRDPELSNEEKIDFFYLMGRAQEQLGKKAESRAWYEQVLAIDPWHRDVKDRLRNL